MAVKSNEKIDILQLKKEIKAMLTPQRFQHSQGVEIFGLLLALKNDVDLYSVAIAALLHDVAKDLNLTVMQNLIKKGNIKMDGYCRLNTDLWHCYIGAYLAENKFSITDNAILEAIRSHSIGKPDMSLLEQILFVADYCEPHRNVINAAHIRDMAIKDLNAATAEVYKYKQNYLASINITPHPRSIEAYSFYKKLRKE